ncbi:MAG: AAA family ATPase [Leptolyngbyaceae cyanobacterium]
MLPDSFPNIAGYRPVEPLHVGDRTTVYRALQTSTNQSVVVKALTEEYPSFAELVQFRNQYALAKNLPLSGIVRPLDLVPWGNSYALVMEDTGGQSLGDYVQQQALDLGESLNVASQLADILHELHQQRVIHKDIKPANILIHPDSKQVKLIDFSIASRLPKETQALQSPGSLEGTLAYLAPEQTGRMNRGIDYRTDFYGLGVTLYQLLTGQLPFTSEDPLELIHCHMAQVPPAVDQLNPDVPTMVSEIVAKLMAKNAEDRYQSALGLKHDLKRCSTQWTEAGAVAAFTLGERDISDLFLIPEKLYGREAEVQQLLNAFDRVAQGTSELMLVAGFSGIGKTAVINEVHKPITRQRGYFIKGKFDQFNRNVPFSAFVQAFRDLVRQLLSESDGELATWKAQVIDALGENAQVIIDLIPELETILGPQPAVPELSGMAAQNRFNLLFQQFIQVFTTAEHPLVIFVDDLQWADSTSLDLMQVLMSGSSTEHLLLLGAYRDNEVVPDHPLIITVEEMDRAGAAIQTITLCPLKFEHLNQLIADTLHAPVSLVSPLTELIMQKTQGNPFFVAQFLNVLHQEQFICLDADAGYWQCDLVQVQAAALTNDVVELVVSRLQKLPAITQDVLKLAACIGANFDLETLAVVSKKPQAEVEAALWEALQARFILPQSDVYKFHLEANVIAHEAMADININYHFLHDRVQQAAYWLIPDSQKPITHLKIGNLLVANRSEIELEDQLFDIVNHLNIGIELLATSAERQQLRQLNFKAALKAKKATAHGMTYQYALIGINLLASNSWHEHYEQTLALHELAAESAYLKGNFEQSQQWSEVILRHVQTPLDEVKANEINLFIHSAQGQSSQAIAIGQEILGRLGVSIPTAPSPADIQKAWAEVGDMIPPAEKSQSLLDLSVMTDRYALAALKILNSMAATVYLTQPQLFPLIILAQVKLSLLHGNTPISAGAYARYSFMLCGKKNDILAGYEFGRLALSLSERFSHKETSTRVLLMVGALTFPWKTHLKESIPLLQKAYQFGLESGNLDGAALSRYYESQSSYLVGTKLEDLTHKITTYSTQIRQIKQSLHLSNNELLRQIALNLTSSSKNPEKLIGEAFNENEMMPIYQSSNNMLGLYCLYLHKAILCYWFDQGEKALEHIEIAANYLMASTSQPTVPLFYLYDSLSRLSIYDAASGSEQSCITSQVEDNQRKLAFWAEHAPMNFQHKHDLVLAEKCRCLSQKLEAIEAYDRAITGAKANGYIQEEALAHELAAEFYLDWGKEKIAAVYMQDAYYCYARWGAKAKVADLETRYRDLLRPILQPSNPPAGVMDTLMTLAAPSVSAHAKSRTNSSRNDLNQAIDFATVLKASQTLASTLKLEDLLCQLTQIILQNSGSDRCILVLPDETGRWQVQAISTPAETQLCAEPLEDHPALPLKLIQYVKNTQETVVLDDLATELPVVGDYLRQHHPQSVLGLPLLHQGRCVGVVCLENRLTHGVFTGDRILVLNFLATQAAISLENARLYTQAQTDQRRLAALMSNLPGMAYLAANDEHWTMHFVSEGCSELTGYTSDELINNRVTDFAAMMHADDAEAVGLEVETAISANRPYRVVYRIRTKQGEEKWLWEQGQAILDDNGNPTLLEGLIIDISDRKAAEQALQQSQLELMHQKQSLRSILDIAPIWIWMTDTLVVQKSPEPPMTR